MDWKMKRSVALTFLVLVCCIAYGQRRDVRFCPRQGASPARGWALMGVARDLEDSLWIRMDRVGKWPIDKEAEWKGDSVAEWWIPGGRGTECLYLTPMAPGRYVLRASLQKGGPWLAECLFIRSDTVMVISCDENYFWRGTEGFLFDAVSGKPIRGAEVRVTDFESGSSVATLLTDSSGAYRIGGLELWKEYAVDAGTQGSGFIYSGEQFVSDFFFGEDTVHVVCRGFQPAARLVDADGRDVALVCFEPNDMGLSEAMIVLPPGERFGLINQDDTLYIVRPMVDSDIEQYYGNQREIEYISSDDSLMRFTVVDHGGEPFRTTVHVDVQRLGEPHPWRMSTFISSPIWAEVIHQSIDSAEFARRFPFLLMDTLSRHSLSEQRDMSAVASYDIDLANGDTASVDCGKLDSGSYRIVVKMPLPEGSIDSVEQLYYHYHTPGYRLGAGPCYADNISGTSFAVGDTLRVKVGSCYRGVTVMCQVEVNGQVVEVKQLQFDDNDTVLSMPLRQRGVVQMKFLAMWQGEFVAWSARAEVGRTRRDWYWDNLYPYETFDMAGQCFKFK